MNEEEKVVVVGTWRVEVVRTLAGGADRAALPLPWGDVGIAIGADVAWEAGRGGEGEGVSSSGTETDMGVTLDEGGLELRERKGGVGVTSKSTWDKKHYTDTFSSSISFIPISCAMYFLEAF